VSSPCPMSWDDLVGNDRVRYCGKCRLNVYNLADMPSEEVEVLVRRTEGRLCGRIYLRGDRTGSLRDCPSAAGRRLLRRLVGTAAVLSLAVFGCVFRRMDPPDRKRFPGWLQDVVQAIDPEPRPRRPVVLMGLCRPMPPPLPPGPQTLSPGPQVRPWN